MTLMDLSWYTVLLASMGWGIVSLVLLGLPGVLWLLLALPVARMTGQFRGPIDSRDVLPMAIYTSLLWAAGVFPAWLAANWLNQPWQFALGLWLTWGLLCGLGVACFWQRRFAMPTPPMTSHLVRP